MSAIEKIVQKLAAYPVLQWTRDTHLIQVQSLNAGGFSVWFKVQSPGFTVGYDGWHEEFDSEEEAINCFTFGLSDQCRLKVVRRGNFDCSWTVESKSGDNWIEDSTVGLFFAPFWRRKEITYRKNELVNLR